MTESQRLVLAFFLLALFAYQGWRRGFIAEMVKFVLITLGILVGNPEWLGSAVIRIINSLWFLFQIAISGGIQLVISGDFSAQALNEVMDAATSKGPLIPQNSSTTALFFFMLVLILVGYLVSARVKKRTSPILGLFMGVVNGLLLTYIFVVPLVPTTILPEIDRTTLLGGILSMFALAFEVLLAPLQLAYDKFGSIIIIVIMVIIIIIAARVIRASEGCLMGPLEILFAAIFLFFVFIALARGYPKELGITTIVFAALFLIMQFLTPYLPQAIDWVTNRLGLAPIDQRTMDHILSLTFSLLFVGIIFAGYAGQTFTFTGNPRKGADGCLLNIAVGMINGYLIAGSLWYFQDAYGYPVADFTNMPGLPTLLEMPLTPTAQAMTAILPPAIVPSLAWGALLILMLFLRVRK